MPKKRYFLTLRRLLRFDHFLKRFKSWLKKQLRKAIGIETIEYAMFNMLYEVSDLVQNHPPLLIPKIASTEETINELLNTEKSLARFGDGEFKMMFLGGQIGFQQRDEKLIERLKEVLTSRDERMMIGLLNCFGVIMGSNLYWRSLMGQLRSSINPYLNRETLYYDAGVTRNSVSAEHFQKLKKIWDGKNIITIEGSMCRLGIGNDLFSNAASLRRILAPAECAFSVYEQILEEAQKADKDVLFLLALGPTATVLAYDLSRAGYRALDIGHLDICYELFLRNRTEMVAIEGKYVNEASYRSPAPCTDKEYLSQIITEVKSLR
ncbi:MAG: GT-D fold domain-containing glycosyltransferase [Thermoguttaceae bacterium]